MASGRTIWDEETHLALLLAVIKHAPPTSEQWTLIIEAVQAQGYNYTPGAAIQHLQKLRRKDNGGGASSGGDGPKTPAKRGGRGGGATSSKRKAKAAPVIEDDDDLGDDYFTPSKKPKREPKAKREAEVEDNTDPLVGLKEEVDDFGTADYGVANYEATDYV
ncbi:hypothetical protein GGTG_11230 [Gaeumannomyces tritici R3-111a-1]|uniref:Uncharacterized protein n=1 Tax=Gaeumannomyces tritici (strain R3-111a-1) TaxID=644352 RepID=J3PCL0_GAET3|nr:hypothetical protein GGTG_11230 [Gaeumannomyces tritici R3-111a-1]EJT71980.1 hypothetical protein GGTG_11230 [Gaeumannomyces tritici R3-111a-1]